MKVVAVAAVAMIALTSVAEAQHRRDHRHGYHAPQHRQHVAPRHNWVPYAVGGLALGALGAGAYYYNRPTACWDEAVYEYDRYGRRHIVAFERFCQ
jgi:hypothetical protein